MTKAEKIELRKAEALERIAAGIEKINRHLARFKSTQTKSFWSPIEAAEFFNVTVETIGNWCSTIWADMPSVFGQGEMGELAEHQQLLTDNRLKNLDKKFPKKKS